MSDSDPPPLLRSKRNLCPTEKYVKYRSNLRKDLMYNYIYTFISTSLFITVLRLLTRTISSQCRDINVIQTFILSFNCTPHFSTPISLASHLTHCRRIPLIPAQTRLLRGTSAFFKFPFQPTSLHLIPSSR